MSNLTAKLQERQILSLDDIRRKAPSVFAEKPIEAASSKYQFISTIEMVQSLLAQGWNVVQAGEHNVRNQSKRGFQKHMLRLNNPNLPLVGDSAVDLVCYNSHDLTTGYKFCAGVYRFLCANGLMTGENLFAPISVKHIGAKAENAIEASYRIVEAVPQIAASVEQMQALTLSEDERLHLANASLVAKFGQPGEGEKPIQISAATILRPRRTGDDGKDLWSTFNVIQENLIRGGQRTVNATRTKRITTRAVTSITENAKLNQALWTLAESMKQLKSA